MEPNSRSPSDAIQLQSSSSPSSSLTSPLASSTSSLDDPQKQEIQTLKDELSKAKKQINELLDQVEVLKERVKDGSQKQPQSRYWTSEEHERFLEAIKRYGTKDVKAISNFVGSRNSTQVRTHAQKYFLRLGREKGTNEPEDLTKKEMKMLEEIPLPHSLTSSSSDSSSSSGLLAPLTEAVHLAQSPETKGKRKSPKISTKKKKDLLSHIISETSESVLAILKDWTQQDYNSFVEGLVLYGEENDVEKKCQLIAQNYLPNFSLAKVLHCHQVLQSISSRENEGNSKRLKTEQPSVERPGPILSPIFQPNPSSPTMRPLLISSGNEPTPFYMEPSSNPNRFRFPNPFLERPNPTFGQHSPNRSPFDGSLPSPFVFTNFEGPPSSMAPPLLLTERRASYPFDSFNSSKNHESSSSSSTTTTSSSSSTTVSTISSTSIEKVEKPKWTLPPPSSEKLPPE